MNTNQAIENLLVMSDKLSEAANSPKNYNTEYSRYLELMSWEMHRHATELKEIEFTYGGAS